MNVKNCRFLRVFKINAIVLYPFVFYCDSSPSLEVTQHEEVHLNQIRRLGVLRFYCQYLYEYWLGRRRGLNHLEAYRNISFEREAYNDISKL